MTHCNCLECFNDRQQVLADKQALKNLTKAVKALTAEVEAERQRVNQVLRQVGMPELID